MSEQDDLSPEAFQFWKQSLKSAARPKRPLWKLARDFGVGAVVIVGVSLLIAVIGAVVSGLR